MAREYGRIIGFVGPKGSGKTFGAVASTARERLVIRYDLTGEAILERGAAVIEGRAELPAYLANLDARRKAAICWRGMGEPPTEGFEWANRAAALVGGCAVLWNEAESLMPRHAVPPHAAQIMRRGRHAKVDCIWTAQRPTNVHPDLRNNSDVIYFFPGFDNTYLKFVEQMLGADGAEALQKMPRHTPLIHEAGKKWKKGEKFKLP